MYYRQLQAWLLAAVGAVEILAFGPAVMPREWMNAGHEWLGLGDLSQAPAIEAVMRQVSFIYGLHGISLCVMATDVVRFRPLIVLMGVTSLIYGIVFLLSDMSLGLPRIWVIGNGGSVLLIGAILLWLLWAEAREARRD
jgi:hypothetical protein